VSLVVARRKPSDPKLLNYDKENNVDDENGSCHTRSKSAPAPMPNDRQGRRRSRDSPGTPGEMASSSEELDEPLYDNLDGEDLMGIYETLDRKRSESKEIAKSHSMEALETPDKPPPAVPAKASAPANRRQSFHESMDQEGGVNSNNNNNNNNNVAPNVNNGNSSSMSAFIRRALRIQGPTLLQKTVIVKKNPRESLGMRIGGGIGSNEGDTPIYIANIHPHGCIGKSKQMKVRALKKYLWNRHQTFFWPN
ncbi:Uncharacterized protein FKW44_022657, partial [Caligus rogercresseyi]